jgi:hypothetical protein
MLLLLPKRSRCWPSSLSRQHLLLSTPFRGNSLLQIKFVLVVVQ